MATPENETTKENYVADRPISDASEDRFQRYGFSKRIAETIINRKSKDSIVFGLFGAWGEGKSSVLNFINRELLKDDTIVRIDLNPWRYSDEDSLLKNFFEKIAKALDKKLQSGLEKFGGFVKKYGSSGSVLGFDFSGIGKSISDVDLIKLKERVDEFLNETSNKIVIFVDDIDRLDKQEIYTLFRLIKLTADFSNTTYILSFDEAMVAAAIGERFGSGDLKAGVSFLEKIIQVPLTIPKAQPEALKKFCFDLINKSFEVNNINISKEEVQRFVYQFSTNILPRLNTPRLAVRYGNTLSFSMPLLNGEVNMVDLMLIEAVKIFYPEYYFFIKQNPDFFIGSYKDFGLGTDQKKTAELKAHLETLAVSLSNSEKQQIKDLISNLFPNLDTVFGNYHFSDKTQNDWYVDQRIVSVKYFDRYFSYAVIEGDISDIEFEELLKSLDTVSIEDISKEIRGMITKSEAGNFIHKLRSRETNFTWDRSIKITRSICLITDLLPNSGGMLGFGFDTTTGQAAIFIYQLLKNHKDKDVFSVAKELMVFPPDFNFAYNLNNWLRVGEQPEDKLFNEEQYSELAKILTERATKDAGDDGIFEKFPDHIHYLVPTWAERDNASLLEYVKNYLDKGKEKVLFLLKAFVPVQRSNVREGEYKIDITKKQYEYITSYFDKDDLYSRILENYSLEKIEEQEPFWIDLTTTEFEELNMVRQFYRWYKSEKEAKLNPVVE